MISSSSPTAFAHHPRDIQAAFFARKDEELDAFVHRHLVLVALAATLVCFIALACGACASTPTTRHVRRTEPLASLVFVPTLLDAVLGGNRRELVLRGGRYSLFMAFA